MKKIYLLLIGILILGILFGISFEKFIVEKNSMDFYEQDSSQTIDGVSLELSRISISDTITLDYYHYGENLAVVDHGKEIATIQAFYETTASIVRVTNDEVYVLISGPYNVTGEIGIYFISRKTGAVGYIEEDLESWKQNYQNE